MKNFIRNYLFKYIFLFLFFLLLGRLIKSIGMDISKAFGFTCGTVLYDVLVFIHRRFVKKIRSS